MKERAQTVDQPSEARRSGDGGSASVRALVRFSGEISVKSRRTRQRFQRRLADNLRDGLRARGLDARITERWSRMYVKAEDERVLELLGTIFGISSFSRVEAECEADLDAIVRCGHRVFAERVHGRRYAVRARRSGDHDFRSRDILEELGAALNPGAEVDLDDPEVTVRVEVRDDRARLFSDRHPGPGGLPLGVQGRALALISGGYDSAVAAWMTLRRGIELDYLFCNLGGSAYRRMVLEVAGVLADGWSWGTRPRLHVLDFGPLVEEMRREVAPSYLQVVLKRLMYRAASRIGEETGADAIVTGESVGQVSSQTLPNLRAIDGAASLPVFRPLLGFDKDEILERARQIGTYDLSSRVREYCAISTSGPVTAAAPDEVAREEGAVDPELLRAASERRDTFSLRDLEHADVVTPGLFVAEMPRREETVVLDTRSRERYREWHWPGAGHRELSELTRDFDELDRDRTYVLYCEQGLETAHLAEKMQGEGYEAYSFRGGARALRELARSGAVS